MSLGLQSALVALLGFWPFALAAQGCDATLKLSVDPDAGFWVTFDHPCQPYAPVRLQYGALEIGEETDFQGNLHMLLPGLAGARDLTLSTATDSFTVPVPGGVATHPFAAVSWTDQSTKPVLTTAERKAMSFGFPGMMPNTVILSHIETGEDAFLMLPVTDDNCGQDISLTVILADENASVQALQVSMPPCQQSGDTLSLQLPFGG